MTVKQAREALAKLPDDLILVVDAGTTPRDFIEVERFSPMEHAMDTPKLVFLFDAELEGDRLEGKAILRKRLALVD